MAAGRDILDQEAIFQELDGQMHVPGLPSDIGKLPVPPVFHPEHLFRVLLQDVDLAFPGMEGIVVLEGSIEVEGKPYPVLCIPFPMMPGHFMAVCMEVYFITVIGNLN